MMVKYCIYDVAARQEYVRDVHLAMAAMAEGG